MCFFLLLLYINTPQTLVWDTTPECERGVILSPNMLRVSMNPSYRQSCRHVVSTGFTDDFTVRLSDNGVMHGVSIVCIGFAREGLDFTETRHVTRDGVYTLVPHVGKLFGTLDRTMPEVYCPLFTHGMVRCVADRLNGTISYHVDGVDQGVAWRGVAPGPLHAVVIFIYPGVSTELIE